MAFWGKLIGGVAGLAVGGPLGAMLGVAAGHGVDQVRERESPRTSRPLRVEALIESGFAYHVCSASAPDARSNAAMTAAVHLSDRLMRALSMGA